MVSSTADPSLRVVDIFGIFVGLSWAFSFRSDWALSRVKVQRCFLVIIFPVGILWETS
jgi:hypothetical protein